MMTVLIVLTGLMAGTYFTFSVVVMRSLVALPALDGATAMNKINDIIVKTLFLPIFLGSTLWYVVLLVWALTSEQQEHSNWIAMAAAVYIVGMFMVTAFGNVPLNNRLKDSQNDESSLVAMWHIYLKKWTLLNHIRTVSCIVTCLLMLVVVQS